MTEPLTKNELEEVSSKYSGKHAPREVHAKLVPRLPKIKEELLNWFEEAFLNDSKKWFAAGLLSLTPQSCKPLKKALLRAAITEENPSFNRNFIAPLRAVMTYPEAINSMIEMIDSNNPAEVAGVSNASYWARIELSESDDLKARTQLNAWKIERFLDLSDVYARRTLIAGMSFDKAFVPDEYKEKSNRVIELARNHEDEYIRHRLEIELGTSSGPFRSISD